MSKINITLVAALIAAFASIGNVYFSHISSSSLEIQRWEQERKDEARKNLLLAFSEYTRELATGMHETRWLLWIAEFSPTRFSANEIDSYNDRIKAVLPRLSASSVQLAAHDYSIYQKTLPITHRFYRLDANIALSAVTYEKSPEEGLAEFQSLSKQAQEMESKVAVELSNIISESSGEVTR